MPFRAGIAGCRENRMKPKVGIGITTYEDIRSINYGLSFYDALVASSTRLAPYRIHVIGEKYDVDNAQDFALHWRSERRLVIQPKYGIAATYHEPVDIGADWRTRGALSGNGQVCFSGRDPHGDSTLTLQHNYAANVDWRGLFVQLIDLMKPAHANLHIFTERELELAGEGRFAFRAPVAGEACFVAWKSSLGDWRLPDPWEVAERRRYRFLPSLAWGNYLGDEFSGRFDRNLVIDRSSAPTELNNGLLFQVTENLSDVINRPIFFESERENIQGAFANDFFRSD